MSADPRPIPVRFYQATVLERATRRTTRVEWSGHLTGVAALPLGERTHDDGADIYEAHPGKAGELVLVGALRAINTDFMTQIDPTTGSVQDVLDEDSELSARQFAHTTVMAFLPRHNVVAVARGGTNAPRGQSAVQLFLTRHVPQERGSQWVVEPVIAPPQIDRLQRAKGVMALEARYETLQHLDSLDPEAGGMASYLDNFAAELGGEVIVDVNVRIASDSRSGTTFRRMKDALVKDLQRLQAGGKPVQARVVYDDDTTELVDLVAAKLGASIELGESHVSRRQYSALLDGLRSVSTEMQTRVDDILGG